MRQSWRSRPGFRLTLLLVTTGIATLGAAEKSAFTTKDKAYYLNPQELAFIRPGLGLEILEASIDADGTIRYRFKLTDSAGQPLDRLGINTPGVVSIRSTAAVIARNQPNGNTLYTAYTVRNQHSNITDVTATQAATDGAGTYEQVADGEYVYTFATKAPAGYDRGATHTIGAWAARNLSEFDLGTNDASTTFDFVPDGTPVTTRRSIVSDQACNQCHGNLSAHDERRTVGLCVTCHQPQSSDPDTGNTVDLTTMIHKIHMGAELPSVQAGKPYQIIGFGNSVHDFSTVEFPADVRNCQTCHSGVEETGASAVAVREVRAGSRSPYRARASQPDAPQQTSGVNSYLTKPSRRACGSCHDNVNFATGENHAGLPQISDNQCANCHIPEGELEFDLSIKGAHTVDRASKELPGTHFEILSVDHHAPGEKPTVTFSISNNAGQSIDPNSMARLALVMGGATHDVSEYFSEDARVAQGSGGRYFYTFGTALPAGATGSWMVGIEGYQNATILAGTEQERAVRDAGDNKVFTFPVGDTQAVPRRKVVALEKCNACHYDLDVHGNNRNNTEHCVICHNPNGTDAATRPADQMPAETINFKDMIHRIHTGENLDIPYTIYGFRSSVNDFSEVRFPNDRRNCTACHIDGTQQLPLAADLLPTQSPRFYLDQMPAATAACLSCHTNLSAAAHADLNISGTLGESCTVCHGEGREFSVDRLHAIE